MRISPFPRRMTRAAVALGLWFGGTVAGGAQDFLLPHTLALAFGVNGTPTPAPTPVPTPTPTPTPPPTPMPGGPRTYEYPADHPLVSITLPAKWSAAYEKGSGKLLCVPTDAQAGYSAVLSRGGDFATLEQARAYLDAQVKETLATAKVTAVKMHPVQSNKLPSGAACQIQVVDGKIGAVATSFVFICLDPIQGKYFMLVARGRSDKLNASGFDVVGAMLDSIRTL